MSNPKQTTAMQGLIEYLDELQEDNFVSDIEYVKERAIELLAKEREQIENAFVAGDERGTKDIPFNAEQYFTQTFKS